MKKLLFVGLISISLVLIAGKYQEQKNYKELLDYFTLNSKGKCFLKGITPKISCSNIDNLSQEDFYTLLDAINQSYDCAIFDYLGSQDEELCRTKYKELNAIVGSIDDCRPIEGYLFSRGCNSSVDGICSSLFKK